MTHPSIPGFLARCGILFAVLLSLHIIPFPPVIAYTIVFLLASIIYLWIARDLFRLALPQHLLIATIAVTLLVRISFITMQPIGSDDIYRYLWEGKVQAAGINPYLYAPDAPELRHLHSTTLPSVVNHPDMKTVYFPLAQWIYYLSYQVSGEGIWGFKLMLFLAETITVLGLFLLTTRLRIPNTFTLLYALCPLPILQFGVDAHMDGLGLPLLVFGLLCYSREKRILAFVLLGLSISMKPVAAVFLPVLWFYEKGLWAKLRSALIPALILVVQFFPYMLSSNPFEALMTFSRHWTFNGVVFEVLNLYFADNQPARLVCGALLSIALLFLWLNKKGLWDKIYYSVLLLLLFSPVVHPWYVAWLVVLLPIAQKWSGILYAATVSLTSFTILSYRLDGVWAQHPMALLLEYLPVVVLMVRELFMQQDSE
jgi:hypothetical protein